jgi:hypothetical protein
MGRGNSREGGDERSRPPRGGAAWEAVSAEGEGRAARLEDVDAREPCQLLRLSGAPAPHQLQHRQLLRPHLCCPRRAAPWSARARPTAARCAAAGRPGRARTVLLPRRGLRRLRGDRLAAPQHRFRGSVPHRLRGSVPHARLSTPQVARLSTPQVTRLITPQVTRLSPRAQPRRPPARRQRASRAPPPRGHAAHARAGASASAGGRRAHALSAVLAWRPRLKILRTHVDTSPALPREFTPSRLDSTDAGTDPRSQPCSSEPPSDTSATSAPDSLLDLREGRD